MSNALAIAGVTAVLRDRLNDGLVNHNIAGVLGSSVTVSVLPPDRVAPPDGTEASQLNLFMYQVSPNQGWRNEQWPAYDGSGRQRLANPPLALDLHYLLTAYTGGDLHAEILLGYAMQLLHEYPVLTRTMIRTALDPSPDVGDALPPALRALADCGLADQVEQLRITPQTLNTEEISKLWTATQASYRPTASYVVSVVLIEATQATSQPLPVLSIGAVDPATGRSRGVVVSPDMVPPLPAISAVRPDDGQPVMRVGSPVSLEGHHLAGTARQVLLTCERHGIEEVLPATGADGAERMSFEIPAARAGDFPVGVYDVSARLIPPGESSPRETNRLGAVLAPDITNLPEDVAAVSDAADLTIDFLPAARANQSISLILGAQEIAPQAAPLPATSLQFRLAPAVVGDTRLARLRIDGIDSPIIDHEATPTGFLDRRVTIT